MDKYTMCVQCDVAVFGGGPSGLIAAAAAARSGAKTVLFEQYSFLGGMATAGLVAPIGKFTKNGQAVVAGIPWELMQEVAAMGGAILGWETGNVPCDVELFKLAAQRLVLNSGAKLYLQAKLVDCQAENGHIAYAVVASCGNLLKVTAKQYIDCTADAVLCRLAGAPMQPKVAAEDAQPASLIFRMGGVDTDALEGLEPKIPNKRYTQKEVQDRLNALRERGEDVPNFGGPWYCTVLRDGIVNINITRCAVDANDPRSVTAAECKMREDVFKLAALLKKHYSAFRNSYVLMTGTQAGLRESDRLAGAHILTGEELINSNPFDDTVAHGAHLVDIHHAVGSGQTVQWLPKASNIPYRSLYANEMDNLLTAGRCISADRVAFASTRVMGTAMATGQAAGVAAAMCAEQDCAVCELDTSALRQALRAQRAIVD